MQPEGMQEGGEALHHQQDRNGKHYKERGVAGQKEVVRLKPDS